MITRYFPPQASNTASLLRELAEDLALSHEVEVIAAGSAGDQESAPSAKAAFRIRRITLPNRDHHSSMARRLVDYTMFTVFGLFAACASRRADIVMTINDPPTSGAVAAIAAARHRCPFVQICHDIYPDITVALGKRREGLVTRVWRAFNRLLYSRAECNVVVGRDMLEKLAGQGVPRRKLRFVPAWASHQEADPEPIRRLTLARGWDERFVVMHAGNIGPATNVKLCAEVADALKDAPDVLFVFLGGGPSKGALVQAATERGLRNVEFLPPLPKKEAQALMAAANLHLVVLVPGLWGCGAPSKAYGIMAAGRPFVASVDPGSEPARIAEELGCGFVVPAGSVDALAAAIRAARSEPLDEMGRRALAGVADTYKRSSATSAIQALLEGAVEGWGSRTSIGVPRADDNSAPQGCGVKR